MKMWGINNLPAVFLVYIAARISVCQGGFCTYYYQCASTCYERTKYYASCGILGLERCSRYSASRYTCYKTCSGKRCCTGYRGSECTEPICDGANACLNGGRCIEPNKCSCLPGYDGSVCRDIDECTATATCEHICTNTLGSYRCSCSQGYQLSYDGATCDDLDECMTNNGGCANECTNTFGSFTCGCNDGYQLAKDLHTCVDVDECSSGLNQCNQYCHNTVGSYSCSCHSGYYLGLDDRACIACDPNHYGQNCMGTCLHCAVNTVCDNVRGHCPSGCAPGYNSSDPLCNTPCGNGTYGKDCVESCGHCQPGSTCNKGDGKCASGCDTGYEGNLCIIEIIGRTSPMKLSVPLGSSAAGIILIILLISTIVVVRKRLLCFREDVYSVPNRANETDENTYATLPPIPGMVWSTNGTARSCPSGP